MATIGKDLLKAKKLLIEGNIIGLPTETVYGLAGNALREEVVVKIFQAKNRPSFDPLICHTDSIAKVLGFVEQMPEKALLLAERFWPGPLTMLFKKQPIVPHLTTSGLDTVAFRIPDHQLSRALLAELDFPLAAPSANPFGYVSPTTAKHVQQQLGSKLPYILDGGPCRVGIESTIIGFDGPNPIVHRLGGIALEALEEVVGKVDMQLNQSSNPVAPGMLKSHYSPGKKVHIGNIPALIGKLSGQQLGVISFTDEYSAPHIQNCQVLSTQGDLNEAARNLFKALRAMDTPEIDTIITEAFPDKGLGRAINDRLKRSAAVEE